jgi:peptidoglycan/xylan/chitin deacetylase (PgdA/CDA1 family)
MNLRKISFGFVLTVVLCHACLTTVKAEEVLPAGNFDQAFYEKLVQINLEAERGMKQAAEYVKHHQFIEALDLLKSINSFAPFYSKAYVLQVQLRQYLGQHDDALKVLEQAGKTITNFDYIFKSFDPSKISGISPPTMAKVYIANFKNDKDTAISFNFDDGPRSVYTLGLPILDEFSYKATINVNPGVITETLTDPSWGTWEEWRDATKRGFEIGNHAFLHHDLTKEAPQDWERSINGSYDLIKEKVGAAPVSFVFPQDQYNQELMNKVRERHDAIRVHDDLKEVYPGIFIPVYGGETFSLETANKIIDMGIQSHFWIIPECHAIYTPDIQTFKPLTADFLRAHLSYLKQKEEKIWVETFGNVFEYLNERKFSEVQSTRSGRRVTFLIKSILDQTRLVIPLTVVVDVSPDKPKMVSVSQAEKNIPFEIKGSKILVNVLPQSDPVTVKW